MLLGLIRVLRRDSKELHSVAGHPTPDFVNLFHSLMEKHTKERMPTIGLSFFNDKTCTIEYLDNLNSPTTIPARLDSEMVTVNKCPDIVPMSSCPMGDCFEC